MPQTPIAHIDVRFFAHATEDPNKVIEAVRSILPENVAEKVVFKKSNLRGHHGNPIALFETKIYGKEMVESFIENLSSGLHELDRENLHGNINQHLEKGSLYMRLDKQAAFHGEFRLCTADPIHIRIRFKKTKPNEIMATCRELRIL